MARPRLRRRPETSSQAVRDFQTVVDRYPSPTYVIEFADLLDSLGRVDRADDQRALLRAQEQIFRAAGVNLDLELALYEADHGRAQASLASARRAFAERQSVFVEDAYAWALHVNGRDRAALRHSDHAATDRHPQRAARVPPRDDPARRSE